MFWRLKRYDLDKEIQLEIKVWKIWENILVRVLSFDRSRPEPSQIFPDCTLELHEKWKTSLKFYKRSNRLLTTWEKVRKRRRGKTVLELKIHIHTSHVNSFLARPTFPKISHPHLELLPPFLPFFYPQLPLPIWSIELGALSIGALSFSLKSEANHAGITWVRAG